MTLNRTTQLKLFSILVITIIGGALRISYIQNTEIINPIRGDAHFYVIYMQNLIEHGTFSKDSTNTPPIPDSYWSPGYPAFLALVSYFSDFIGLNFYETTLIIQTLLGASIIVLTILIGDHFLKFGWALLAGVFVAISPHMITLGSYLLTETLFSFLLLLSLYLFCMGVKHSINILLVLSALSFALGYLVNPVIFFLPLFLIVWLYLTNKNIFPNINTILIVFFSIYLGIVASWSLRNSINVPENTMASSSRLLTNLIIGSHSNYYDIWRKNPRDENNPASIDQRKIKGSYTEFFNTLSDRIIQNPTHYLWWYAMKKPYLLWNWNILIGQGDIYVYPVVKSLYDKSKLAIITYSISKSVHYWLVVLAGIATVITLSARKLHQNPFSMSISISILYISAAYIVTQSEARYSIPLRPQMYLSAMLALSLISTWAIDYNKKIKTNQSHD